jgi:hypothetical protein
MESFEVIIGPEQRKLTIEPLSTDEGGDSPRKFKIIDNQRNEEWLKNQSEEDVPTDNVLGVLSVESEKDFTFDGSGDLSGNDLLAIAAQITRHPSFY